MVGGGRRTIFAGPPPKWDDILQRDRNVAGFAMDIGLVESADLGGLHWRVWGDLYVGCLALEVVGCPIELSVSTVQCSVYEGGGFGGGHHLSGRGGEWGGAGEEGGRRGRGGGGVVVFWLWGRCM